ncbi:hypothetical protein KWH76_22445, partial [Enterobacter roggenkampii]|nr:hypothetical protein [Enterobacter roggenkampii]
YLDYSNNGIVITKYAMREKKMVTGSVSNVLQGRAAGGAIAAPQAMPEESLALSDSAGGVEGLLDVGFKKDTDAPTPQIRQNFNETAFFFPQLRTNEKGETLISFTVPESNTTWRFRALAHDKDARVGTLEQLVVTRKELMVTPNMPRFVRQGDKTS